MLLSQNYIFFYSSNFDDVKAIAMLGFYKMRNIGVKLLADQWLVTVTGVTGLKDCTYVDVQVLRHPNFFSREWKQIET